MTTIKQADLFIGGGTLEERFWAFHSQCPEVYALFKRFSFQIIKRGHIHYSAYAIGHVIRWHTAISKGPGEEFKLNNNYVPFYARKFMRDHPKHAEFFHTRVQRHSNSGSLTGKGAP